MEKLIKRSIILVSIIICIILICIIAIKIQETKKQEEEIKTEIEIAENVKIEEIEVESRIYMYLFVDDVLNKAFEYVSEKEKNVKNAEVLVSILDSEYKEKNNITEDNVLVFLKKYKDIDSYSTKEIYRKEINQGQNRNGEYFYIKGIIRKDGEKEYIYIQMKQDYINSSYSISFMTEDQFNIKGQNDNAEIIVHKNDYNKIYSKRVTDYEICLTYLNDYINTIKNNPTDGYELLDREYRNEKFANIEEYTEYINKIKDNLSKAVLKSYSTEKDGENTQYICKDQRGCYYIFEKTKMMNYTVILDTYTLELPQFIEKYNEANTAEKVGYNIQKCIEAINNKDYLYVYGKLYDEFRQNNYATEKEFIKAIESNLYETNEVKSVSSTNEGNTYIYKLTINDMNDDSKEKNMTVIMQIKEGTDFVMSFSFEE